MRERILMVDDEVAVLDGYRRALRGRYDFDAATGAAQALEMVRRNAPYAVVVADMQMPGMNGMELLASVRELSPNTVRTMITGNSDQKTAVDAVNSGNLFRFLNKPCDRDTLVHLLDDALAEHRRIIDEQEELARRTAEIKGLNARLAYESRHDVLTGLLNRDSFEQALEDCMVGRHASFAGAEHVLCHLDLDHFHVINDTHGRTAGDAVLRDVADALSTRCRVSDVVGRLGGDEFGIVLVGCTAGRAEKIVREICQAVGDITLEWDGRRLEVSTSVGMVPIRRDGQEVANLLNSAETACDVAKELGRGQWHVSDAGDAALTARIDQAQWVVRIGDALREDRFRLLCQEVAAIDGHEAGEHYELLIRMVDEQGRLVPPAQFLGAAERYQLSPQIDRWVISTAANWLRSNPQRLERIAWCSINLSGHSLVNPETLRHIHDVFGPESVLPHKICFEITETAAISHLTRALHFIGDLTERGFRFALDDFGSGLSSFAYLKNLPVDVLKIDGAFVKHIDRDPVDRALVRSINEIAKVMGKHTVAEYVENADILRELATIGVDYAQGFHISAPRALDELGDAVGDSRTA